MAHPAPRREYYEALAEYAGCGPIDWPEQTSSEGETPVGSESKPFRQTDQQPEARAMIDFEFQYPDYRSGLEAAFGLPTE